MPPHSLIVDEPQRGSSSTCTGYFSPSRSRWSSDMTILPLAKGGVVPGCIGASATNTWLRSSALGRLHHHAAADLRPALPWPGCSAIRTRPAARFPCRLGRPEWPAVEDGSPPRPAHHRAVEASAPPLVFRTEARTEHAFASFTTFRNSSRCERPPASLRSEPQRSRATRSPSSLHPLQLLLHCPTKPSSASIATRSTTNAGVLRCREHSFTWPNWPVQTIVFHNQRVQTQYGGIDLQQESAHRCIGNTHRSSSWAAAAHGRAERRLRSTTVEHGRGGPVRPTRPRPSLRRFRGSSPVRRGYPLARLARAGEQHDTSRPRRDGRCSSPGMRTSESTRRSTFPR